MKSWLKMYKCPFCVHLLIVAYALFGADYVVEFLEISSYKNFSAEGAASELVVNDINNILREKVSLTGF